MLLAIMAENNISPREAVDPLTSLHLIAMAVGELNPWWGYHDRLAEHVQREAPQHADLARALVQEPGIERWWAPLDHEHQGWIEPESRDDFPSADSFPTPDHPPTRQEHYVQWPEPHVVTSTLIGDWTSQTAAFVHWTDWHVNYPARRKHVRVLPSARVLEIITAEDWHTLVARHGARSSPDMTFHPDRNDVPWATNDGLVPDWSTIAREWDGVHWTTWAHLTATQVRIESDAGWSEPWAREGEETTWLNWAFDAVDDLPSLDPNHLLIGPSFLSPYMAQGNQVIKWPRRDE